MSDQLLDFISDDQPAGFRLQRLELYNWGTFDRQVWNLELGGENTLLTGDIGSGKSTLVDALTTLLVPPQKLAYNKAAGADNRERSLRSYVLGHFKSERGEAGLASKAVALRDQTHYSVILGSFRNAGYDVNLSLAQVFWNKEASGQPARFYVISGRPLSIAADFTGFGDDMANLRKRLRQVDGVELFDSFPGYGATFRRVFGIENEQALDLFNQTVSLKSVGNLTDFVREHMIEPFDAESRIKALIEHFDDLNRAHETVLKAKAQIAALTPLVADGVAWDESSRLRDGLRDRREALGSWFAVRKLSLAGARLERLAQESARLEAKQSGERESRLTLKADRDELKTAIATNGGERLERLAQELDQARREKARRQERRERYRQEAAALELPQPEQLEGFAANREWAAALLLEVDAADAAAQNERTEADVAFRGLRDKHGELQAELASLRSRQSNIPARQVDIRERLCHDLGLSSDQLPFAGELLRVGQAAAAWEGAIERVLHNFALSLLVDDRHYQAVCAWVDGHDLAGRLVYFRVRTASGGTVIGGAGSSSVGSGALSAGESGDGRLRDESLVRKLDIKTDTPWTGWLEQELTRRFDYACTDSLEQFHRERQALRPSGQIKGSGERHEKDDRHRIDDTSRYVLGWSNLGKIKALERQAKALEKQLGEAGARISRCQDIQKGLQARRGHCGALLGWIDWSELDWQGVSLRIADLEAEQRKLASGANILKTLQARLGEVEGRLQASETTLAELGQALAVNGHKRGEIQSLADSLDSRLAGPEAAVHQAAFPALDALAAERQLERGLSLESAENREHELRLFLQAAIDAEDRKLGRLRDRIVKVMEDVRNTWRLETRELDASVEAMSHWALWLQRLVADDLPRFEASFKTALNENAIREVANFHSQLNREREDIRERIERINQSLVRIDYNPGRYIVLEAEPNNDGELRDFQADLRSCTEGSFTGQADEQYAEAKFLQVRALIERFRGREGFAELDRRWTRKISDVRQYFVFSASERWREGGSEHEHYTDAAGKSGGQKEKLAYTVLAASLAYQFGLEWGSARSRSFRFVMIDEAFGRGSDESTRFGLELFRQLRLQLLVITPLQKIHVIEPYVRSVGFVYNPDGSASCLRNLSIAQYQAEREAFRQAQA
ncbi:MAG: ATP-dependent exonuclease SbcCD, C subunit-like protein [Spirochaetes bacterium GWD1_61_31]|nr:MAG: ATP-dependent exonuclease SbcCD, C subunit-like protein [Spirochaetes bacterium GWB1_60_80]OHD42959.1 MAG: ATP-dependent exonuclease SbcCD, C subunit-like protein [Spirochaetes bacterium GWD1_61_31]OHD46289.1 MAG: ATP-dependent exonuclease SbcCD, C subunit-like protein [Spirochaetes bacterium GWE1_60_18]OHD60896.1 MAG: ATP-dependent exonuclease SbcCD, C subunit-like protein [Spirochaetes bacterium GWF1_60_12]HAP42848.1 ATP-dependent exonuclease SbcCD, C subunit-like protein [Spirochaeta